MLSVNQKFALSNPVHEIKEEEEGEREEQFYWNKT